MSEFGNVLHGIGSWSAELHEATPPSILNRFRYDADTGDRGWFGTFVVLPTWIPVDGLTVADVLALSTFSGVYVGREKAGRMLRGFGLPYLLGAPDGGLSDLVASAVTPDKTLANWIADHVLPLNGITAGSISASATTYELALEAGMTRFEILQELRSQAGVDWRVNPDATLDLDTTANLFVTDPTLVLDAYTGGLDPTLDGMFARFGDEQDVEDFTTSLTVEGKTGGTGTDTATVPFYDLSGAAIVRERYVVSTRVSDGDAATVAGRLLGRYEDPGGRLRLTVEAPDVHDLRSFVEPGDSVFVNHPDLDLFDDANEIPWRGEAIHPPAVRVLGTRQPLREGMGFVFIDSDSTNEILDVTEYVKTSTGSARLEVGAIRRSARVI